VQIAAAAPGAGRGARRRPLDRGPCPRRGYRFRRGRSSRRRRTVLQRRPPRIDAVRDAAPKLAGATPSAVKSPPCRAKLGGAVPARSPTATALEDQREVRSASFSAASQRRFGRHDGFIARPSPHNPEKRGSPNNQPTRNPRRGSKHEDSPRRQAGQAVRRQMPSGPSRRPNPQQFSDCGGPSSLALIGHCRCGLVGGGSRKNSPPGGKSRRRRQQASKPYLSPPRRSSPRALSFVVLPFANLSKRSGPGIFSPMGSPRI